MNTSVLSLWIRSGSAELGLGISLLIAGFVALVGHLFLPAVPDAVWTLQPALWVGLAAGLTLTAVRRSGVTGSTVTFPTADLARLLLLTGVAVVLGAWVILERPALPVVVWLEGMGVILMASGVLARWRYRRTA